MFEVSPPRLHQWHPQCVPSLVSPPRSQKTTIQRVAKGFNFRFFPLQKSDEATVKNTLVKKHPKQPGLICRSDTVEGAPVQVGSLIPVFSQRVVFTTL